MATTVYDALDIELRDGSVVTLRPLPIKRLKEFMVIISAMENPELTEVEGTDIFVAAAMLCLDKEQTPLATDRDKFEEIVDTPSMMKILDICGGLRLNDPNLLGASLVPGTI